MWAVFWVLIFDKSIIFFSSNFFPTEKTKCSTGSQLQKEYSEQESNDFEACNADLLVASPKRLRENTGGEWSLHKKESRGLCHDCPNSDLPDQ
jgi:hypothetical protein